MKCVVVRVFLVVSLVAALLPAPALAQTKSQKTKRNTSQSGTPARVGSHSSTLKICQGIPIPDGYMIVSYETAGACPHGAYVLKKQDSQPQVPASAAQPPAQVTTATASRPRKVNNPLVDLGVPASGDDRTIPVTREPTLQGTYTTTSLDKPMLIKPGESGAKPVGPAATSLDKTDKKDEEVSEGDVVRIDTNFVTVPVSVLDRQGRFIPDLKRDQFKLFENGVEQKVAYFEPNEKPFTVALVLDTSASTFFHLWEIKEAAIAFAKQLRPQDRVLVVTFDKLVMLLTEATNDQNVVTEVIERNAVTGFSTRLYDAIDLVINERLNKIDGRKAIVLFTDGVDTASYQATYNSTLREVEELDALIYPIQYDTRDFAAAQNRGNSVTIVSSTTSSGWPFPSRSTSRVVYNNPTVQAPGTSKAEYQLADQYLHQLADKSGGRLYKANDRDQLAQAFSKIAEELRYQYSLGYYPQTTLESGERRMIKVKVEQPDVAVRARDSYVQRAPAKQ
jgi:Ca-activated chloride channel family protein